MVESSKENIKQTTSEYIINYYNHEIKNCLPQWIYIVCLILFVIGFLMPYFWCGSILLFVILFLSYYSTISIVNNKKIKEIEKYNYISQLGFCKNKEDVKHSRGRYSYSDFYIIFQKDNNVKQKHIQRVKVSEYAYKNININDKVLLIEYKNLKQKDIIPISFK